MEFGPDLEHLQDEHTRVDAPPDTTPEPDDDMADIQEVDDTPALEDDMSDVKEVPDAGPLPVQPDQNAEVHPDKT